LTQYLLHIFVWKFWRRRFAWVVEDPYRLSLTITVEDDILRPQHAINVYTVFGIDSLQWSIDVFESRSLGQVNMIDDGGITSLAVVSSARAFPS
jgi:hypothetical protein